MKEKIGELKEYISQIKNDLIDIEECAKEIIAHVENGVFISNGLCDRMIKGLDGHVDLKKKCMDILADAIQLDDDHTKVSLVEERIALMEKDSVRNMVALFYDLHSDKPEVESLLDAEKDKLNHILDTEDDEDNLRQVIDYYVEFADAVNTIEYKTPAEKLQIMQKFTGVFGAELTMHAFALDNVRIKNSSVEADATSEHDVGTGSSEFVSDDEIKEIQETDIPDEKISEDPKTEDSELVAGSESVNEDEGSDVLLRTLRKYDAVIPDGYDYGMLSKEISPKDDGKIGASKFRNEIKTGFNPEATIQFLRLIAGEELISLEFANGWGQLENVSGVLHQLMNKGYLRKYVFVGKGGFYCASPRLKKALQIKDVNDFLRVKNYDRSAKVEILEDMPSIILCRTGFARLYTAALGHFSAKEFSASKVFMSEFCSLRISNDVHDDWIITSTVSENRLDEVEEFRRSITDFLEKQGKPDRYIIGAADVGFAERTAKALIELFGFDSSRVFLYAIGDELLYSYDEREEYRFEQIWMKEQDEQENKVPIAEEQDNEKLENVSDDSELGGADVETLIAEARVEEIKGETAQPATDEEKAGASEEIVADKDLMTSEKADQTEKKVTVEPERKYDKKEILRHVYEMINGGKAYCALSYLCAFSGENRELYDLWRTFAYAANDPLKACRYSSTKMYNVYLQDETKLHDYLFCAATIRTFFYNNLEYDYSMNQLYESNIQNIGIVDNCSEFKNAFHTIVQFKDQVHKGINEYADYKMQDNVQLEKRILEVRRRAEQFFEERIGVVKESTKQERFVRTKRIIFAPDEFVAECLKYIIDGDRGQNDYIRDFVCSTFIKENSEPNIVNIDAKKMDDFIDEAWDKAGNAMRYSMKSNKLMGSLRGNLKKTISSAIEILCSWLYYSDRFVSADDDVGIQKYKQVRDGLIQNLQDAKVHFQNELLNITDVDEQAGCNILILTIDEMIRRLNGSYTDDEYKYYYIDFLRADLVLLDEDYLPVMDMNKISPEGLSTAERILDHSTMTLGSFEERLEDIFVNQGDDFGSAKLIIQYLGEDGKKLVDERNYDIEDSVAYARRGAQNTRQEFIENLELMQSYGQLDNSADNTKDKYLQIANRTYDYCNASNNFGFYKNVIDSIIQQIKKEAKRFGNTLIEELTAYKKKIKEEADSDNILERLEIVQEMLDNQNYTVAQDLLARIKKGDLNVDKDILPDDYLQRFIEQYESNLSKTADSGKSLINVITNKLRNAKNKDTNAGRRLIENWPKSGMSLDSSKLSSLLTLLGFTVDSVTRADRIGKIENYTVKLSRPTNGRKVNYKHPIAAFGSVASNEDFRVSFLSGNTDADRLVMTMRELGSSKHTILIVDYAIDLRDRRKLARKIKEMNPTKVFGVIDRVLIMFLAENYNDAYINQMLLSVMMPFSYVQPYVWDSGNVMPPEIFMGRDKELKDIEAPTGVNIVYGGRQLGKSALLKMAKADIAHDEDGRRAVYVDIKGKDYKQSARKIGQTLYDEGILPNDFDGDDWDELSREIKKRLNSDKNRIPYLLLLLDEADAFIESCEAVNYSPFDALKDIQNVGTGRFKFVIAGLRNIVKFTKGALENNSVLTHLGHTTIVPFNYSEARELLEKPLYYLGLRFPKDKEALVSLIFANANYFPGLIQLYCAKLVEAMTKDDYAGYDQNESPVYLITQEHIKKVLAEDGFVQQVREKFEITLKLDEDNYYYIIALLMATLYHNNGYSTGYSVDDIYREGYDLEISKIRNSGREKLAVFMDELCELNVLRRLAGDKYVFNRYNFFQMMGTQQEVEDKLMEYMGD